MSRNQPHPKIIVADSLYEILAQRRADHNARLAADGLPPANDDFPFLTQAQADAEAKPRSTQKAAASPAPPPPTRGPLCRAAKAKVAERNAAIPGFDRHSRKCQICRSPYADYIEQVYLQWESVDLICRYFQLADTDTLYRHARAAGLDVLRRQNSRWVVEQFIEQWRTVKITSSTVIRSIRALSCLDEKGRWTDLPKTHILVRGNDSSAPLRSPDAQEDGDLPPSSEQSEPHCGRHSGLPGKVVTSSTGETIPATTASDTGIPEAGSTALSALSTERSSQPPNDAPLSCERSSRVQVGVLSSFERSEPHGRDSGLPSEVVTSVTEHPEAGPTVLAPSTERSEPLENPSADSNRVSMGN